jgi:hypothetical protein
MLVLLAACATARNGSRPPSTEDGAHSPIEWKVDSANADIAADLRFADSSVRVRPVGALSLSALRTVVLDGNAPRVFYFDAHGTLERTVDLSPPDRTSRMRPEQLMRVSGDTFAVTARGQAVVLDQKGEILHRFDAVNVGLSIPERLRLVLGVLQGDKIVIGTIRLPQRPPLDGMTRWVDSMAVYIVDGASSRIQSLGALPAISLASKNGAQHQVWFGANAVFASRAASIYYGFGSEYQIKRYSSAGELLQTISRPWTKTPVTRADIDAYIEGWGKNWIRATGAAADSARQEMHLDPFYPYVPAFSQFIVSQRGELWVRSPNLIDAQAAGELNQAPLVPGTWSVFNSGGRWIATAMLPAESLAQDVSDDIVLAIGYGSKRGKIFRYHLNRPGP